MVALPVIVVLQLYPSSRINLKGAMTTPYKQERTGKLMLHIGFWFAIRAELVTAQLKGWHVWPKWKVHQSCMIPVYFKMMIWKMFFLWNMYPCSIFCAIVTCLMVTLRTFSWIKIPARNHGQVFLVQGWSLLIRYIQSHIQFYTITLCIFSKSCGQKWHRQQQGSPHSQRGGFVTTKGSLVSNPPRVKFSTVAHIVVDFWVWYSVKGNNLSPGWLEITCMAVVWGSAIGRRQWMNWIWRVQVL